MCWRNCWNTTGSLWNETISPLPSALKNICAHFETTDSHSSNRNHIWDVCFLPFSKFVCSIAQRTPCCSSGWRNDGDYTWKCSGITGGHCTYLICHVMTHGWHLVCATTKLPHPESKELAKKTEDISSVTSTPWPRSLLQSVDECGGPCGGTAAVAGGHSSVSLAVRQGQCLCIQTWMCWCCVPRWWQGWAWKALSPLLMGCVPQDPFLRICMRCYRLLLMYSSSFSSRYRLQWGDKADLYTPRVSWGHVRFL